MKKVRIVGESLNVVKQLVSNLDVSRLDISENDLNAIPDEVLRLEGLLELCLNHNLIKDLDLRFMKSVNLNTLIAINNCIETLTIEAYAPSIKTLILDNNKLSEIPPEILNWSSLESLKINNNKIENIDINLNKLKNLKSFSCAFNSIKNLPYGFNKLLNLEELNIEGNPLKIESINDLNLPNLRFLNARTTNIAPSLLLDLQKKGVKVLS